MEQESRRAATVGSNSQPASTASIEIEINRFILALSLSSSNRG